MSLHQTANEPRQCKRMKICSSNPRYAVSMGHGVTGRTSGTALDMDTAKTIATTMQALATPSRLLILATLQDGPATVGRLADAVGMEQSAVSHQLRLLRNLGLVQGDRQGRNIVYSLTTSTSPSSSSRPSTTPNTSGSAWRTHLAAPANPLPTF